MRVYNITDFGAIGDGKTNNTANIQNVIDMCCDGDEIVIPQGVFVSGALFLHRNMKIFLSAGAVLKGSCDVRDYPPYIYRFEGKNQLCYSSLINVCDGLHKNIEISGLGMIDGSGIELFDKEMLDKKVCRGRVLCIQNTDNCVISGITVCNSVAWTMHLIYCNQVEIKNVKLFAKQSYDIKVKNEKLINGDGIIIDSCTNVEVLDCVIDSQDDCVSIKSGKNVEGRKTARPSSNVFVHDNFFIGGAGVSIGSEMSGGIKKVVIEKCKFVNVLSLFSLKTNCERGGFISDIMVRDCCLLNYESMIPVMPHYKAAIYIDCYYKTQVENWYTEELPKIDNIVFENLYVANELGKLLYIRGIEECPISNVIFNNIQSFSKDTIEVIDASVSFENVYSYADRINLDLNK